MSHAFAEVPETDTATDRFDDRTLLVPAVASVEMANASVHTIPHAPIGLPVPLTHHAWYPLSPCGSGCLPQAIGRRRRLLAGARLVWLVGTIAWCLMIACAVVVTPRLIRRRAARHACRALLRAVGIRVAIDDRRPFPSSARALVVANHISFLAVLAVAVVNPAHFVAKSDVASMPVISAVARFLGVITVERESLRRLPSAVDDAARVLERDRSVAVFPEGTTRCGRATGAFRPAFFQAAIDAGVPVQPMAIRYTNADGTADTSASFIGDDTIIDTLRRVLTARNMTVTVRIHEMQLPGSDRRELAERCERLTVA